MSRVDVKADEKHRIEIDSLHIYHLNGNENGC